MFYDVTPEVVQVLAIVTKAEAAAWLAEHGTPDAPGRPGVAEARRALDEGRGVRLEDVPS